MSLKKICCVAAADKLPKVLLQQPDYRELLHRSLPHKQQLKLFKEAREYYPDEHLKCKTIGNKLKECAINLTYAPEGHLRICSVVDIDRSMILRIWFTPGGEIRRICFCNPDGYGFEVARKDGCCNLAIQYLGKPHGISRHCSHGASFCSVYEHGNFLGSIFMDMDLD